MKSFVRNLFSLIVFSLMLACSSSDYGGGTSFSDSYDLTYNGCNTGRQSFSAKSQAELTELVCTALVDDERNKFCARTLRQQRFDRECSDTAIAKKIDDERVPPPPPELHDQSASKSIQERPTVVMDPDYKNRALFEDKKISGTSVWVPSTTRVTYKLTHKTDPTQNKFWAQDCKSSGQISLVANYPKLEFSLGNLRCADNLDLEVLNLIKIASGMSYDIRKPEGLAGDQFLLSLSALKKTDLALPRGFKAESLDSLNANVTGDDVFLDLLYVFENQVFFEKIYYFLDVQLVSSTETLNMKLNVKSDDKDVEVEVTSDLLL